ncbi:ATP-binding cassette domain-containing protein [Phytoactinopolyspora mesophila]|uniref:ATP-binding cassette domain-containing protein n=1 Tax=Phytoactinopolyspora mesophila TaxID=2650750 RepID=A0A7K3M8U7_9ACTN|nr:ATP-binding cassette domain-containing protein [Phytoactinopolyspora mesophila]NDL59372.1 ATP-binding cassette domain-containing protein [Phytoactinopolyspora mesophila]
MTADRLPDAAPDVVAPLLDVRGLTKVFEARRARRAEPVVAVDQVSFQVERGETFGLIGESGSGKTTAIRCLLRLVEPTSGAVTFGGDDVLALSGPELRTLRARMQVLFQDPYSSLDSRMSVRDIVAEPLTAHRRMSRQQRRHAAEEMLRLVGIDPVFGGRRAHTFSGGQRQRIALARALILNPELVVLDEPVSALDVSVQAQIINMLREMQARLSLTYVVVLHDLAVARYFCDRVAVMRRGRVVETGPAIEVIDNPQHPYTQELLAAVPGRHGGEEETVHAPG